MHTKSVQDDGNFITCVQIAYLMQALFYSQIAFIICPLLTSNLQVAYKSHLLFL